MASPRIVFDARLEGTGEERIKRITNSLSRLDTLEIAARVVKNNMKARFLKTLDPDEQPWEVSQAALRRRKRGKPGKTLFDTGRLFRSIQIHDKSEDSIKVGVPATDVRNTRVGGVHQNKGFRGIVRRFIGINDTDIESVRETLENRISKALNG